MTDTAKPVQLDRRGRVAVLTVDNPPVNALSHAVRLGLSEGLRAAAGDPAAAAIAIVCAGRTFIAGADITEFGKPPREPGLADVLDLIEGNPKPVVAGIHGTALGGGLEVALACHYRVGVKTARFGLPEVKLGLLPGAGGTQRLPRVVGVETALQMIVSGDPIGADEALRHGLIDQIVEGDLGTATVAFAERVVAEGRPLRKIRDLDDKLAEARRRPELFAEFRKSVARQTRGFRAPERCIQAVEAAVSLPFAQGLAKERELFRDLMSSPESQAQRYFFFAEREAAKIPDVPPTTATIEVRKAAVIGAGTMGGGIAMNFANAGIPVTVIEVNREALDRGLGVVRKNYEATAARGRLSPDELARRLALIRGSVDFGDVADADLIIEAVFEEMPVKKEVFARLDGLAKPGAVLATNTSTLNVDEIASATKRPESVIGMHFFSPANVMRLLEVVRGARTSKPVIATAMAVGRRIAKVPVLVGVCDGFVGNRMLHQRGREAERLILEGALPQQVDKVLFDFGFPMGPFAMGDLAGPGRRLAHPQGQGHEVGGGRPAVRDGTLRPEDRRRLLPLRGGRPDGAAGPRGGADHPGGLARGGHRAPADPRRGDPGPPPLPDGQRGREDPRREARHPGQRHRRHLGVRLRLAGVPRRPDALGGLDRPRRDPQAHAGAEAAPGPPLAAGRPPGAAGRVGRRVHAGQARSRGMTAGRRIEIRDTESGTSLGEITEAQLRQLVDLFEEESGEDRDYWIDPDTLDMLADAGADAAFVARLRAALGDREGFELGWREIARARRGARRRSAARPPGPPRARAPGRGASGRRPTSFGAVRRSPSHPTASSPPRHRHQQRVRCDGRHAPGRDGRRPPGVAEVDRDDGRVGPDRPAGRRDRGPGAGRRRDQGQGQQGQAPEQQRAGEDRRGGDAARRAACPRCRRGRRTPPRPG